MRRNPARSARKMARDAGISPWTMMRLIHEDMGMETFKTTRQQFLTTKTKAKRRIRAKLLLDDMRSGTHPAHPPE